MKITTPFPLVKMSRTDFLGDLLHRLLNETRCLKKLFEQGHSTEFDRLKEIRSRSDSPRDQFAGVRINH